MVGRFGIAALVVTALLAGCDQSQPQASSDATSGVGRFIIVHSPHAERDTVLLDTATGQSWQMVEMSDLQNSPTAWVPMPQLNTDKDWAALRAKSPPVSPSGAANSGGGSQGDNAPWRDYSNSTQ